MSKTMRNKELFNELNELCEKYGFVEVQSILKGLGLREFENENKPSIGEKLSDVIDYIVHLHQLKKRHLFEKDRDDRLYETLQYFNKEIRENQMVVLNEIME